MSESETVPVVAAGIESEVATDDEEPIGHVLMADLDGVDPDAVEGLAGDATVVVETSGGSHVYGLVVRPWEDVVETLREDELDVDAEYVEEMDRRGRATLRTTAEVDVSGGERAPAPVVRRVFVDESVDLDALSAPHARRLAALAPEGSTVETVLRDLSLGAYRYDRVDVESVGSLVVESKYRTRTDGGRS